MISGEPGVPARDVVSPLALVNAPVRSALLEDLSARLAAGEGFSVATMNLDHLAKLRHSDCFDAAYRQHSHVVADGRPVVWLRALAGAPVELVPGSELIHPLMAIAARQGVPVGFLGTTEAALDEAARRLEAAYPGLRVVARVSPSFGFDPEGPEADAALQAMASAGARLILVALGAPKQEVLAVRGQARFPQCGFVSVGAGIDFIAGTQRRAPRWVRRLAMEWLWRLLNDPRRLAGRYLNCFLVLPALMLAALRMRRAAGSSSR